MGAVLLLAFCLNLGAELSSLVGFNYIDSLATAFKKKKKVRSHGHGHNVWVLIEFSCSMRQFWLKWEKENSTVCVDT